MRPTRGDLSNAAFLSRLLLQAATVALAVAAASSGCGACSHRRDSGVYVEIPDEVLQPARDMGLGSVTLKIRIRALEEIGGRPGLPVDNGIPEQVLTLPTDPTADRVFEGRHGLSFRFGPDAITMDDSWRDARVVIHFALFTDSASDVADAFDMIDDPTLERIDCGGIRCSHVGLAGLNAIGAYSLTIERLFRDDADVVLYPLFFDNVDIDPDGDTIPGAGAMSGPECVAFLDGDFPWADQRVTACESILDVDHLDCDDTAIHINPFEFEPGDAQFGLCDDGIRQDCSPSDGPCFDLDGDGFTPPDDCDDSDPCVYPGASEETKCGGVIGICDGIDQDCDNVDFCPDCDLDDDGFCPTKVGTFPGGDCCDVAGDPGCAAGVAASAIHPGAPDVCGNSVDENCDGVDPLCANPDADGDGHCSDVYDCNDPATGADPCAGNMSNGRPVCCLVRETIDPSTLLGCSDFADCADWDAAIGPGLPEVCGNATDDDCDPGTVDDCPLGDTDGDGYPPPADCVEGNPDVHPNGAEVCGNGIDDDCAGGDVPCAGVDADGDGYIACGPSPVPGSCDCNDASAAVHPGAAEQCDTVDSDCDGIVNDGNPDANDASGVPAPCYGNPIDDTMNPMYLEVLSEAWRCRVGQQVCGLDGSISCVHYVRPDAAPTASCADDNVCNGRNDVCLPCGAPAGPDVRPDERDLDGDTCFICTGADDLDGFLVTAGDACGAGHDCCDDGSEAFPGCSAGNAPTMNTNQPELCSNQAVDNDCNGDGDEICGTDVGNDPCTTGLPGICGPGMLACSPSLGCSAGTGATDGGQACGTFCNPSTCPYATPELCNTPGVDDDCDGSTDDVDDETSPGVFLWRAAPVCTPNPWDGACACMALGPLSICVTDSYQCTGPAMPTCSPPVVTPPETCGGGDTDCNGVDDFNQDLSSGALCSGTGTYCDGATCSPGCNSDSDCSNGNTCPSPPTCTCAGGSPCTTGTSAPDCLAGACHCGDASTSCGPSEGCTGVLGDCTCNGTTAPTGEACPNASAAPDCVAGTGCRCQTSLCGPSETCTGVGGDCSCSGTTAAAGEACPNTSAAPDCVAGTGCRCETSICGPNEGCSGTGGDCTCLGSIASSGEACPNTSAAPDCVTAVGCRCEASTCGPSETCTGVGGDCACGATTAPTGEACANTSVAPDCISGACHCGDGSTTCGGMETCTGVGGDCACGATTASTGEACPNSSTTGPDCLAGVGCRCQASLCGANETCTGAGGDCSCNGTTAGVGEACVGNTPDCISGVGCRCGDASTTCGPLETCNGSSDCQCNATSASTGEACSTAAAPDCVPASGCRCETSLCGPSETCTGVGGDCSCNGTTAPSGEACTGAAPDCVAGVGCRCETSVCGPSESCNGSSDCACGATTASSGEACVNSSAGPDCISGACHCGDVSTTCGSSETCTGVGGDCACGATTASTGEACVGAAPDCLSGACHCGDASTTCGAMETCTGAGGDCSCGGTTSGTGEACSNSTKNPDCSGSSCYCMAEGAACGADADTCNGVLGCICAATGAQCAPGETCTALGCQCGSIVNMAGTACQGTGGMPICSSGVCDCNGASGGGVCGADEVCSATNQCQCNATIAAGGAQACPDSGPNAQCFPGTGCRCGDSGTTCDADETCSAPSGGDCTCVGDTNSTGPACPASDEWSTCFAGVGCGCVMSGCSNGFNCNTTSHRCECNGASDCNFGICNANGLCDCDSSSASDCTIFGEVCNSTTAGDCSCTGGSCED